jgi:hypothetical protein
MMDVLVPFGMQGMLGGSLGYMSGISLKLVGLKSFCISCGRAPAQ